jgi:hypothetical protein
MKKPELKTIIVLAELRDGKIHQIALKPDTTSLILALIAQTEGSIDIIETPIEGIYIEENAKKGK